ncbi:MAG: RIP metalloprotease RseP [Ruminococcaceae bacterium]|nr:RIP metalloprotease RseP [Oscillospiraceae bacterium]
MNPVVQTILTVVIAVVLFMLVILIHELGHFFFAKLFKVKVNEFAIGMGPRLFGWRKGETEYSVRLIPIGGYCAMEGEDEESSDQRAFNRAKVWKRIIIVVAGAVFNIILGLVFMVIIQSQQDLYASNTISGFYPSAVSASDYTDALAQDSDKVFYCYLEHYDRTTGEQSVERFEMVKNEGDETVTGMEGITWQQLLDEGYQPGVIQTADKGTNCHILRQATSSYTGLRTGDTIYSVNGSRALCFNDAYFEMAIDQDNTVDMVVIREGEKVELKGVAFDRSAQGYSVLDFTVQPVEQTFGSVISQTFLESQYMVRSVYKSLFMLITGSVPVSEMSGPIGIASAIGEVASVGFKSSFMDGVNNILYLMALITFNLGIVNLLPLPALDGGRLIFLIVEAIRRKPVPPKYEGIVHMIGFALLMALMVFIAFNDISKLVSGCSG